jgi:N-acetylmuramoyl-L-alanine amidase
VLKPAVILVCGLAVLAGCTTAPREPGKARRGQEPPADWQATPTETPAPAPPAVPPAPAPALTTLAAPAPPELTWLPLRRWCQQRGLGDIRRLGVNPLESFALPTPRGVLILTAGSRAAYWDRTEIRLGFAPRLVDGQLFVHALDAQKNFDPLVRGLPVAARTNRVIVIDPGHGGSNLGARSVADGRREKEFTLDWALRLAGLLATNGWRVFLTRTGDVDVSLTNRVAFAEQQGADLFLSLHFNSLDGRESDTAGLETYCLTPAGMASTLTRGYRDDPSQVFPNNAFDEPNFQYAVRLHRALLAVNGDLDRGVRRARFPDVLRGQRRPAVLIEGGYLSNLKEARRIGDPAYRQKLAEALARALE